MHLGHVSTRAKSKGPVLPWLESVYKGIKVSDVFGFTTERCRLYGGRYGYESSCNLTSDDLNNLYSAGVNLSLPLQTTEFTDSLYDKSLRFLDKHHRTGNKVVLYSDEFRERIAEDFPKYKTIASVIKNFEASTDEVKQQLDLYDYVVIPTTMSYSDKRKEFPLDVRSRIISFTHTACTQVCVSNYACYRAASKQHAHGRGGGVGCRKRRPVYKKFYTKPLEQEGFERFKYSEAWEQC